MATNARQRLLDAAEKLFYAEGIQAVGLERLLAESEVGRASFYRHFASKDDLVVAMLSNYDEAYRTWLAERTTALGGTPIAAFDALIEYAETSGFRGCAFINAIAEVAEPDSQIRAMANQHKEAVVDYLRLLLAEAGYPDDTDLARQLLLLMDGAAVTELYERSDRAARQAKTMALAILER
ncbi:AcrR family transcriptional regulator [Actinoalloteichus hoggarensis]|uniref:HTH-type transcriptional repressor NemR n=1 Tax=Actinoalloteichus hoggarensis TaxID=1470176 RepID=A0A221WBB8_9PSEU|nr:TetR/AcrR family transcriptional regulator [Actinoalloteichus hoggarensis]ASO23084.1 HTH-type transcriptional repressor NemR [Actinoalloteichus hoggarensis]MBB5922689.1 AcrR family transcriptional regulator [Actinoalloteichus hoggarensis]